MGVEELEAIVAPLGRPLVQRSTLYALAGAESQLRRRAGGEEGRMDDECGERARRRGDGRDGAARERASARVALFEPRQRSSTAQCAQLHAMVGSLANMAVRALWMT